MQNLRKPGLPVFPLIVNAIIVMKRKEAMSQEYKYLGNLNLFAIGTYLSFILYMPHLLDDGMLPCTPNFIGG